MSVGHYDPSAIPEEIIWVSHGSYDSMLKNAEPATEEALAEILSIDVKYQWAQDALCAQVDPELFFPDKGGSIKSAVALCWQCPVRRECLESAFTEESERSGYGRHGIRGGLTARQRSRIANTGEAPQHLREAPEGGRPAAA